LAISTKITRNDLKAFGIIYKLEKTFKKSRLLEVAEKAMAN
jgi:hypothetical protein